LLHLVLSMHAELFLVLDQEL